MIDYTLPCTGQANRILLAHHTLAHETFHIELVLVHQASPHNRLYIPMYYKDK